MYLSTKNISKISNKFGFIKDNIEKVLRLVNILEFIFSTNWKNKFVLKGGTAINLFYLDIPRLSVDIDLDYLGNSKDEMAKDKENLFNFIKQKLSKQNYNFSSKSKRYFALDSLVFQYINNAGNLDNIKIEINYINRKHLLPINLKIINNSIIHGNVKIQILDPTELFASKIAALLSRCKARDVYDVYMFSIANVIKNKNLLKKCCIFYCCVSGNNYFNKNIFNVLNEITNLDIKRQLKPMLSKSDRFGKEEIKRVGNFLKRIMNLNKNEFKFIEKFNCGDYLPDLLFTNRKILKNIQEHPLAIWRCENIKQR